MASKKTPSQPARKPAKKTPKRKPPSTTVDAGDESFTIESPLGDFVPLDMMVKYQRFAEHYITTGDGVGAVVAAELGEESKVQSNRQKLRWLLNNAYVRKVLTDHYRAVIAKTRATVERVWEEISYQAFLDPAVFYDENGDVLPMNEIPESARRALTGMKVKTGTIGEDGEFTERELKYANKDAALEKMMRLHRMVDNDKTFVIDGAEWMKAIEEGRQRAAGQR